MKTLSRRGVDAFHHRARNSAALAKNPLIRNHIALVLSDVHYEKSLPYILEKINNKETFTDNGSLVHALAAFDMSGYLVDLVKIICEMGFEPRLMAYGIVEATLPYVQTNEKKEALKILTDCQQKLEVDGAEKGEDSTLHFIEQTIMLF